MDFWRIQHRSLWGNCQALISAHTHNTKQNNVRLTKSNQEWFSWRIWHRYRMYLWGNCQALISVRAQMNSNMALRADMASLQHLSGNFQALNSTHSQTQLTHPLTCTPTNHIVTHRRMHANTHTHTHTHTHVDHGLDHLMNGGDSRTHSHTSLTHSLSHTHGHTHTHTYTCGPLPRPSDE